MSESFNYPRYRPLEAQVKLERAEAVIDACFDLCASLAAVFTRVVPPATNEEALKIRRAWLRASA